MGRAVAKFAAGGSRSSSGIFPIYYNKNMIGKMENRYFWFLIALAVTGAWLALMITSLYGPGVSADATKYLSVAENLRLGHGFFDHTGRPLLWWPPLYPLVLAGTRLLTGLDVVQAGGYLNLLVFAINIFLHGALIYAAFPRKPFYYYTGALVTATSDMAIRIHVNISSEPLFVTFSLIFLFACADYLKTGSRRSLGWMIAMSALACLQRYLGASLIAAGVLIIMHRYREPGRWLTGIRESAVFGVLSILPIAAWIGFHNLGIYGSFWGVSGSIVDPLENLRLSLAKILHWFLPWHPAIQFLFDTPWIPAAAGAMLLLAINKREDWKRFAGEIMQPIPMISLVFFALTIFGLMFSVTTEDHVDLFSDRYYAGLLSQVLILLFVVLDTLVFSHTRFNTKFVQYGFASLFAVWLVFYPGWSLAKYAAESLVWGEASGYNVYNNYRFHNHPIVKSMQTIAAEDPSATLYSNYTDAVWFFTRRDSPVTPRSFTMDLKEIEQNYPGWPGDQPGYLFWILPNSIYRHAVPPKLLAEIADLEIMYKLEEGEVYRVKAKE